MWLALAFGFRKTCVANARDSSISLVRNNVPAIIKDFSPTGKLLSVLRHGRSRETIASRSTVPDWRAGPMPLPTDFVHFFTALAGVKCQEPSSSICLSFITVT